MKRRERKKEREKEKTQTDQICEEMKSLKQSSIISAIMNSEVDAIKNEILTQNETIDLLIRRLKEIPEVRIRKQQRMEK